MSGPATISVLQAINLCLDHALEADPTVVLFGEDIGDEQGGGVLKATKGLSTKYGVKRVRTTPIAEQAIIGAGIGAALGGMRPVAEIMLMNFTTVAMDMIVNHAAKLRFMSGGQTHVPMTIRTMSGTGRGSGGQHADMLEAWFAHTAGLKVVAASSPADTYGLMMSCIFDDDPCLIVEHLPSYSMLGAMPEKGLRIPLGKACVAREGSDVTVIGYSRTVNDSRAVAEKLSREGISIEIVDLRTLSPLDMTTVLKSVGKTKRVVVVHEAVRNFGVGAEVSARINEELFGDLQAPVQRLGAAFCPNPFAKPLETAFIPSQSQIENAIRTVLR